MTSVNNNHISKKYGINNNPVEFCIAIYNKHDTQSTGKDTLASTFDCIIAKTKETSIKNTVQF